LQLHRLTAIGPDLLLLSNKIADTVQDSQPILFASGFDDGITDLQVGPDDGYLYVLTLTGSIYRIVPSSLSQ
jgi:aldose sugar dehydrogenase